MITGFLRHAATSPDAIALTIGHRDYTYAETADIAARWAAGLMHITDGRPKRVAVFAMRNETSYFGPLAAAMVGAAYVPLNRRFPLVRNRSMLELADVDAVIVDSGSVGHIPTLFAGLPRLPALLLPQSDREFSIHLTASPVIYRADLLTILPLPAACEAQATDLAYLMFTSGSSGTPKGVPVTRGNVQAFLDANSARYRLGPDDRLSQTFEPTFDLSVFDMFMAWENGARVCAMEPIELLSPFAYLDRHAITVWFSVPSVASALLRRGALTRGRMPKLRWSLFCGEALTRDVAEAWQSAAPNSIVENLYGPTELTIACAVHRWHPRTSPDLCTRGVVPIGRPYPEMDELIIDADQNPVEDGGLGELWMTGPQTTPGYWRAPELTAQRFVGLQGKTYYRTGDLVRRHTNGELEFVGRNDQQVKLRGHRVELGEIEAILRRAGGTDAICLLWPDDQTVTAIVNGAPDLAVLTEYTAARLPNYMRPTSVHRISEMPLTVNGKVDRAALRTWLHDRTPTLPDPRQPSGAQQ